MRPRPLARRPLSWPVFALWAALAPGCGAAASADDHPCPPGGTELSWESFGRPFLDRHCQRCHGAQEGKRDGAPFDHDFSTHEAARRHRHRIYARAADENDSMPPGPDDPPEAERAKLGEWLGCGAP